MRLTSTGVETVEASAASLERAEDAFLERLDDYEREDLPARAATARAR